VSEDILRIGVPSKGRMAEQVEELMALAGPASAASSEASSPA
jgi:hypothetical protein